MKVLSFLEKRQKFISFFLTIILLVVWVIVPARGSFSLDNKTNYSKEQVFKGIIFGRGVFTEKVPELKKLLEDKMSFLSSADKQNLIKVQDEIYNRLAKNDPNFLSYFQTEVLSHNYLRIDNALKAAGTQSLFYFNQIAKESKGIAATTSTNAGSCVTVTVFVNILAVAEVVILVLAVFLAYAPSSATTQTQLQHEMIVNSIAHI